MIIQPKRDDNREWKRLYNEELDCLYCSPNIIRVIISRRLRWAGHVARMEEARSACKILQINQQERDLRPRYSWEEHLEWIIKK